MTTKSGWLLAIGAAALTLSCASMRMSVKPQAEYDFGALHRYAWAQTESITTLMIKPEVQSRVRDAINSALRAKGFTVATPDEADFLVRFRPVVEEKIADPGKLGGVGDIGAGNRESSEGGIVIEMLDRRSGGVIWTGTASSFIGGPSDAERVMLTATPKLLEGFPPK